MSAGQHIFSLSREHTDRINDLMLEYLMVSQGLCCLLIRRDGKILITHGDVKNLNLDDLAALLAGGFATSREIAKLLGEPEFTVLQNEGEKKHLLNILIDKDAIFSTIYPQEANGERVYENARSCGASIAEVLENARSIFSDEALDMDEVEEFDSSTRSRLNAVFGESSDDDHPS